jgi:diguanylate cyclase (GGDEF)-like protein
VAGLVVSVVVVASVIVVLLCIIGWHRSAVASNDYIAEVERLAQARAEDFAVVTRLSEGLASIRDVEQLKQWLAAELPAVVGTNPYWVVAWINGWTLLAGEPTEPGGVIPRAFTNKPTTWECFPLTAAGQALGMMSASQPPEGLTEERRRLFTVLASLTATAVKNLQQLNRARALSMIDPLTGCLTRQFGIDALHREMRRMRRGHTVVCAAMLDLDHFKRLNDTLGHPVGDRALAMVGRTLREGLRATDIACRYGGDEFLIVFPDTTLTGALRAIENIRSRIHGLPLELGLGSVEFGASIGVTAVGAAEDSAAAVIARADAALYEAKRSGRDTISAYPTAEAVASHRAVSSAAAL